MADQAQIADIFSCPLCNNSVYPIYDHDLTIYNSIATWLKNDIKLVAISRVLSDYAVKLYENNITTVDKLRFKMEQNDRFLLELGFDDYDAKYIRTQLSMVGAGTSADTSTSSATSVEVDVSNGTGNATGNVIRDPAIIATAATAVVCAEANKRSHRELLIKFYRHNNGDQWTERRNWCSNAALADWYGISVEPRTENVIKIQLSSNNIVGSLPAEWSKISTLTKLDLSDNHLSGECPPSWGALSKLEVLYLRDNMLSGTLPAAWSSLSALTALDMNGNELGGVVPPEWSALTSLNACIVYNNYFDSDNNAFRLVLPNCRNIDAEMPTSDDGGLQSELGRIEEGDEDDPDTYATTDTDAGVV